MLVLGFARPAGEFEGHAWVEVDGAPLLESSDPEAGYVQLVRFAAGGALLPAAASGPPGSTNGFHRGTESSQEPEGA
jgi:hypothetical protein